MALRYWVGGTANWDGTAGTKWSDTSGGAGGFSVPTSADDVFFDAASGAVTVTSTVGVSCLSINFTGFTGTFAGSTTFHIGGNVTLGSGMTTTFTGNFSVEATPATNIDNADIVEITGLAQAITSMTTNLTGTPYNHQMILWEITDNGTARAITWGASFASTTNFTLPTTTVASTLLRVLTEYNSVTGKHECIGN